MKLSLILIPIALGKTPHNRDDVEKMNEHERKEFDRDILFDSDEESGSFVSCLLPTHLRQPV